eukprot:1251944-Alexandrium_andersonii.AAC.1
MYLYVGPLANDVIPSKESFRQERLLRPYRCTVSITAHPRCARAQHERHATGLYCFWPMPRVRR